MTSHDNGLSPTGTVSQDDGEVSLLDIAIVVAKHKTLVLLLPLVAGVIAALYSLIIPSVYTASTKILSPQSSQIPVAALMGQLGSLAGVVPSAGRNTNDVYVAMFNSRTVADALIARREFQGLFTGRTPHAARHLLAGCTSVITGKDSLITISVEDTDPERAAALANAYVEEFYKLNQTLAVTEASQRRLFFERQLAQARENLAFAEKAARQALEKGGVFQVQGQGQAILEASARLRGQITVQEIQIGAMRSFASENNPELLLAYRQLEVMKQQLGKLEGVDGEKKAGGGGGASAGGTDSFRLLRDVKYHETIQDLLAKQYETARIEEARDASLVQVLDKAIPPEQRTRPRRTIMVILTMAITFVAAVLFAFVLEWIGYTHSRPEQAERLSLLRQYLRLR